MDDGHFPFVIEAFDGTHAGVEAELIIDMQDLIFRNAHSRPIIVIQRIRVWDHGV